MSSSKLRKLARRKKCKSGKKKKIWEILVTFELQGAWRQPGFQIGTWLGRSPRQELLLLLASGRLPKENQLGFQNFEII